MPEIILEICAEYNGLDPLECTIKNKGEDPCRGCKHRDRIFYSPSVEVRRAFEVSRYIETFSVRASEITWFEYDLYLACQRAKAEFENDRMKDVNKGNVDT